jgi:hypothetical protein
MRMAGEAMALCESVLRELLSIRRVDQGLSPGQISGKDRGAALPPVQHTRRPTFLSGEYLKPSDMKIRDVVCESAREPQGVLVSILRGSQTTFEAIGREADLERVDHRSRNESLAAKLRWV